MKRSIKLAVVAALALGSTSAFATNGDVMIGQGAKSRAMGGVGVATSFGADSGLANPALLSSVENMEFTATLTTFMPSVSFGSNALDNAMSANALGVFSGPVTVAEGDSASDLSFIPEFAFAHRVTDSLVYGVSMTGTAGMGTDYKDLFGTANDNGGFGMQTNLQIAKFSVPVSYTVAGVSMGLTAVSQVGSLQMNYAKQDGLGGMVLTDADADLAYAFGFELGLAYDLKEVGVEGLTLGLVYKSEIEMEYSNQIGRAVTDFGVQSVTSGDVLTQPSEYGLGVSYVFAGNTIAADYRMINWGDATGYKDFGWENQSVIALGYEYAQDAWAARVGYNYGSNPIAEQDGASMAEYDGAAINFFNLSGFPGVVESHITLGGTYNISKAFGLDASFVYAPEVTNSYDTTGMTQAFVNQGAFQTPTSPTFGNAAASAGYAATAPASTADVTHSQMGITIAGTYKF